MASFPNLSTLQRRLEDPPGGGPVSASRRIGRRAGRHSGADSSITSGPQGPRRVMVGCPDARPPAYQAVVGLARARHARPLRDVVLLRRRRAPVGPRLPARRRVGSSAGRTSCDGGTTRRSREARSGPAGASTWPWGSSGGSPGAGLGPRGVARWRTRQFDRGLAQALARHRPEAALVFSDVGSEFALPACRKLGIPAVLSMVHGDVREEQVVLEREAGRRPTSPPSTSATGRSTATSWPGCTPEGFGTSSWPTASSSRRSTSPGRSSATGPCARGSPSSPTRPTPGGSVRSPASGTTPRARSSSPAGSPSARGSSTSSKPGGASDGPAGGSSCSAPCRAGSGRWPRISTRWSRSGGSRTPRSRRAWPPPTCSSSPRCSKGRPSSPTRRWRAGSRAS